MEKVFVRVVVVVVVAVVVVAVVAVVDVVAVVAVVAVVVVVVFVEKAGEVLLVVVRHCSPLSLPSCRSGPGWSGPESPPSPGDECLGRQRI